MTSLSQKMAFHQVCPGSGKVYGPLHPAWLEIIEEISDRIRVALGLPSEEDTKPMKNIRKLLIRLGDMIHLAREDDYWFMRLPEILRRVLDEMFEIEEFWVPSVVRDLIYTIECLKKT
jgi:hypothetical protein